MSFERVDRGSTQGSSASAAGVQAGTPVGPGKQTLTAQLSATAGPGPVQRKTDPATEVHAVKSKEIEAAEGQETNDWPGVVARQKHQQKDIEYHLSTKLDAGAKAALDGMHTRWTGTVVTQAGFDPVNGALDAKALRGLIAADQADAAKLTDKRFKSVVEWTNKLGTMLGAFLDLRQRITEERTEFNRFDDDFLDKDVATSLAAVPGNFRPADLKAMLAQETGDFTDTNIAGLEGKSKGITHKLSPNPSFVGVGQINDNADKDARTMAAKLGVTLPAAASGAADPRRTPSSGIKIAANYVAYIGSKLDAGLPAGKPTGAEMRKLVLAAYNGGPFGMIAAAKEVAGKGPYTWETISTNQAAMAHFQKPGEVKDYVKRVTERAP